MAKGSLHIVFSFAIPVVHESSSEDNPTENNNWNKYELLKTIFLCMSTLAQAKVNILPVITKLEISMGI